MTSPPPTSRARRRRRKALPACLPVCLPVRLTPFSGETIMPIVFDTSALLRPLFTAAEFTATKWDGADDKAMFAKTLCKFIAADFKESLFTNALYGRLHLTFGHIANYNCNGFRDCFFNNLAGKIEFLEQTLLWPCFGDRTYTYCDVERAVQARLKACNLLAAYRALRAAEIDGAERELLRRLQAKYTGAGEPTKAPVLHAGPPPRQAREKTPTDQQSLF
jgi:hypothetical protein